MIPSLANIRTLLLTDEELGCQDLSKIIPDTWQNISWVIQNSIDVIVK